MNGGIEMAKNTKTTTKKSKKTETEEVSTMKSMLKTVADATVFLYTATADRIWVNSVGDDSLASLAISTKTLIDPNSKEVSAKFQPSTIYHTLKTVQALLALTDEDGEKLCTFVNNATCTYIQAKKGYLFKAMCTKNSDGVHYNVNSIRIVSE